MGKTRDVLGHLEVEIGKAKRKCHHSRGKHAIPMNTPSLAVYEAAGGRKNYCRECAAPIIELARKRLASIEAGLNRSFGDY